MKVYNATDLQKNCLKTIQKKKLKGQHHKTLKILISVCCNRGHRAGTPRGRTAKASQGIVRHHRVSCGIIGQHRAP